MKQAINILKERGFKVLSDLNYCTDNGIEYFIGYDKFNTALVVALMHDEELYLITKEELREMSLTARTKGIEKVILITNYGVELHSKHEKAKDVGFDAIMKETYINDEAWEINYL